MTKPLQQSHIKWARDRGWVPEMTSGGHIRLTHPKITNGKCVIASKTASDRRSAKNMKSNIIKLEKKFGFFIPQQGVKGKPIEPFVYKKTSDHRTIYTITCSSCKTEAIYTSRPKSKLSVPSLIAKRFRKMGWQTSRLRSDDLCPACQKKAEIDRGMAISIMDRNERPLENKHMPVMKLPLDIRISLSSKTASHFDELIETGLWGNSVDEVAKNIIYHFLRGQG